MRSLFMSADIMSSLCVMGVRIHMNNFCSKTTKPRDMLFFFFQKNILSIEDEKLFKTCRSVCFVCLLESLQLTYHLQSVKISTLYQFSHSLLKGFLSYLAYVLGHKSISLSAYQAWIFLN